MNQKIKALGLAVSAVLALAAFVPAAAQSQFTFEPAFTLSGSQGISNEFQANAGVPTIKCSTATFHGNSVNLEAHSLVMNPTYSGCKDAAGRIVDVIKNTASFRFTSGVTAGETKGNVDVTGEIVWTVTSGGTHCTITVGSQTLNGVSYKSLGGTNGVEVVWNTTNVHSAISGGFFPCGTSATTSSGGATTYTGTTVVTAKDASGTAWPLSAD